MNLTHDDSQGSQSPIDTRIALKSAYCEYEESGPTLVYTDMTADYIFYTSSDKKFTSGLNLKNVLKLPSEEELLGMDRRLVAERYPSDHFRLEAVFAF